MPTGYTAAVEDGTVTSFREFALQCARAMCANAHMREEPMDVPIRERKARLIVAHRPPERNSPRSDAPEPRPSATAGEGRAP